MLFHRVYDGPDRVRVSLLYVLTSGNTSCLFVLVGNFLVSEIFSMVVPRRMVHGTRREIVFIKPVV